MSEENGNVQTNVYLTPEQVAAGEADLENGTILKISSGVDEGGDFYEYELIQHPAIELAGLMLREEVGQAIDLPLLNFIKNIFIFAAATPGLSMLNFSEIIRAALPWQSALVMERMRLGLPFDESAFPGQGAIQPVMNFNVTTPEIRLPEQPAPVVNLDIKNELPAEAVVETVDVERDSNGFIERAIKTRKRKQPAPM